MDGARTWIQSVLDGESQHGRLLTMAFPRGDGPQYAVLLVNTLHAREEMSRSFRYQAEVLSDDAHIALTAMMGKMVTISLVRNDGSLRHFNGYVTEFSLLGADGGLARYRMVLEPWMAFTRLRQDCVSFHNRTVQEITELTLRHCMQHDWQVHFFHDYPALACANQYNESDYNHLHRRWEAHGWHYRYEHRADGHTLWLGDDTMLVPLIDERDGTMAPDGMPFRSEAGSQEDDSIHQWQAVRRAGANKLTLSTFDYKYPSPQRVWAQSRYSQGGLYDHEVHEYGGAVAFRGNREGEPLAQRRVDGREAEYQYFEASGNDRIAQPGRSFRLEEHFSGHAPRELGDPSRDERGYLILSVEHSASNNYQDGRHAQSHYSNRFTCIRQQRRWYPARGHHSQPCPDPGLQTALVVGPEGEEIHTDELGRIKLRFHWERVELGQGLGGPWVRVAMPVAGSDFGQIGLPRVGQEVVVQFVNGNADHPIVTGVVYNGKQGTPWALDGQKVLSGWRSREIGGGGRGNHLMLDDTASQISAQLASDHGNSALNLGYLTEPRNEGIGAPRGEGVELRSDQAIALQGKQGVLINAGESGNRQLARDGLVNAANALQGLTAELDSMAKQHEGESAEGDLLQALVRRAEEWDVGTNVSRLGAGEGDGGGTPIVAANGTAGTIVTSADSVLVGSQARVDVASVGDAQVTAGRGLFLRATRALQIFAAKLGVKLIAGSGNIQIAAHDGEVVITALKRIRLISNATVVLEAPTLQFIAQGARSDYGDGKITHQGSGTYTVKHSEFHYQGAGDSTPEELKLPSTETRHDQQVQIMDMISRQPLAQRHYRITVEDGSVFEGTTDENGMTQRFASKVAFAHYKIELTDDGEV